MWENEKAIIKNVFKVGFARSNSAEDPNLHSIQLTIKNEEKYSLCPLTRIFLNVEHRKVDLKDLLDFPIIHYLGVPKETLSNFDFWVALLEDRNVSLPKIIKPEKELSEVLPQLHEQFYFITGTGAVRSVSMRGAGKKFKQALIYNYNAFRYDDLKSRSRESNNALRLIGLKERLEFLYISQKGLGKAADAIEPGDPSFTIEFDNNDLVIKEHKGPQIGKIIWPSLDAANTFLDRYKDRLKQIYTDVNHNIAEINIKADMLAIDEEKFKRDEKQNKKRG